MVKIKKNDVEGRRKHQVVEQEEEEGDVSELDDDEPMDDPTNADSESERPLKMVLKLSGGGAEDSGGERKRHKHKKKKKKKSSDEKSEKKERKRKHVESSQASAASPATKKPASPARVPPPAPSPRARDVTPEPMDVPPPEKAPSPRPAPPPPPRVKRPSLLTPAQRESVMTELLMHLHKMLQRKDINEFFAYPVNDVIAPGYSTIITHPMDFSTMRSKIDNGLYTTLPEYKADFVLMCNNAMTYNHPDTVYYKAAQKLLNFGMRQTSKEKFSLWKRSLAFMTNVTPDDIGMDDDDVIQALMTSSETPKKRGRPPLYATLQPVEPLPPKRAVVTEVEGDKMEPDEILAQVEAAAQSARDKLAQRAPDSKLGFLRRRGDGSTSLSILNPDNSGIVSDTERVVQLGSLHKLTQGTVTLPPYREDKRNIAKAVHYLDYGSFSTFAPSYDSVYANLTKDESDMLLRTYGDSVCTQYATSLQSFVGDSGDSAIRYVDNLLDILTNGEHSKTKAVLEANAGIEDNESEGDKPPVDGTTDAIKSETGDQADVKPQDMEELSESEKMLQSKLDETADRIRSLQSLQNDRLSHKLTINNPLPQHPNSQETQTADDVTRGLADMAKLVQPSDLISPQQIHTILGIGPRDQNSSSPLLDTEEVLQELLESSAPPPAVTGTSGAVSTAS